MKSEEHDREGHGGNGHGRSEVEIVINDDDETVHRGRIMVTELKELGSIPEADVLEQVVDGRLTELADDGSVTIKGGERFISHPRDGGSA